MAGLTLDQLSSSFDSRLDNNSQNLLLWSASFEEKLENLGIVPVTNLNEFSASITASFTALSSSIHSNSASFNSRLNSNKSLVDGSITTLTNNQTILSNLVDGLNDQQQAISDEVTLFSGSQYKTDSGSFNTRINVLKMQSNGVNVTDFNTFTQSANTRISDLQSHTASYLTSLNGAISSSAQVLAGSGIYSSSAQLPANLISGSSQISALGFATTGSNTFTDDQIVSGTIYLPTLTQTFNIGDVYQGGEIAYIYQDGDTDYEAGKIKGIIINTTEFNDYGYGQTWGGGSNNTDAQSDTDGVYNTEKIALTSLDLNNNIANLLYEIPTNNLIRKTIDGYDDWFIPSFIEWSNLIYPTYVAAGKGTFGSKYYWTSTQYSLDTTKAYVVDINGYNPGNITTLDKATQNANASAMAVRFVRKFTVTSTEYILKYTDANKSIELGDDISTLAKLSSNSFNGNQIVTGSISASQGFSGSINGIGNVSDFSSSLNSRINSAGGGGSIFVQTGSAYNTTNNIGITGSLTVSSSAALDLNIIGTSKVTGSFAVSGSGLVELKTPRLSVYSDEVGGSTWLELARPDSAFNVYNWGASTGTWVTCDSTVKLMAPTLQLSDSNGDPGVVNVIGKLNVTGSLMVTSSVSQSLLIPELKIYNNNGGSKLTLKPKNGDGYEFSVATYQGGNTYVSSSNVLNLRQSNLNIQNLGGVGETSVLVSGSLTVMSDNNQVFGIPGLQLYNGGGNTSLTLTANSGTDFQVINSPNSTDIYKQSNKITVQTPSLELSGFNGTTGSVVVYGSMKLAPQTVPTGTLTAGMMYFDSGTNHFYGYNGTEWKQLDN